MICSLSCFILADVNAETVPFLFLTASEARLTTNKNYVIPEKKKTPTDKPS